MFNFCIHQTNSIMKNFFFLIFPFFINAQTNHSRTIIGRVIDEVYLKPLPELPISSIKNSDTLYLGMTDLDGRFKICVSKDVDSLLFRYIGMEWTDIKLKKDCDTIELILMKDVFIEFNHSKEKEFDRLQRLERFNNLPNLHSEALKKRLFKTTNLCYERAFKEYN